MILIKWSLYLALLYGVVYCYKDQHKRTNQLPNRTVIVQLFEWKWLDIADECERFLGPKGYGAVQTSPATENLVINLDDVGRPWYERYQVMSYKIQTRSGSEEDFLNMTTRCNKAGVRIYVDVVFNHMTGGHETNEGTGGSTADFDNFNYPAVPYTREHFHQPDCDINNYDNATEVRDCKLVGLKDLNQTMPYVQQKIAGYLNKLVSLGVAGFRVDAAKHMWPGDLKQIYDSVSDLNTAFGFRRNTRPYIYQEVTQGGAVTASDYTDLGDVTEFTVVDKKDWKLWEAYEQTRVHTMSYLESFYQKLNRETGIFPGVSVLYEVFTGEKLLSALSSWGTSSYNMIPSESALVFTDNHDTQRAYGSLNYKYGPKYQAAVAFLLAHKYGQARFTSSYFFDRNDQGPPADSNGNILSPVINQDESCGGGWVCEHRWDSIRRMVGFRNTVHGTKVARWWDDGNNQIAFSRGQRGFIVFNIGSDVLDRTFQTGLPAGTYCDINTGENNSQSCTGKTVTVSNDGLAQIRLNGTGDELYLAIHIGPESRLPL